MMLRAVGSQVWNIHTVRTSRSITENARIIPRAVGMIQRQCSSSNANGDGNKTKLHKGTGVSPLDAFHRAQGGKMVDFAGWALPVKYDDQTHVQSHEWTRSQASLFDVSHMMQTRITGPDRVHFAEAMMVADIQALPSNMGTLSVMTNHVHGGIVDDVIITNAVDHLYLVSNAGRVNEDIDHMKRTLADNPQWDVTVETLFDSHALVALQGPMAASVLETTAPHEQGYSCIPFMGSRVQSVGMGTATNECRVTRCGYTGEDGFEIMVPIADVENVVHTLMRDERVRLAGLGARDSLRLEAGLCLYGSDMNEHTTAMTASLLWTIPKSRREKERATWPGANYVLKQIAQAKEPIDVSTLKQEYADARKAAKEEGNNGSLPQSVMHYMRRIGAVSMGGPSPRAGMTLVDPEDGSEVGYITSGCPAISTMSTPETNGEAKQEKRATSNIAMGYVLKPYMKAGTQLAFTHRKNKQKEIVVTKMPFVPTKYYKMND